ncbi:MAG: hydroxymethylbilane synthase [Sphingorhabdus sp.]
MSNPIFPTIGRPLRIGTRKSPLAMAQAKMAASAICAAHDLPPGGVEIIPMLASGDKIQDRPLAEIGGKALWTKELERALIEGAIDIAVHSMKDVETARPESFIIAAMLPRADVRDRLIGAQSIAALPEGAVVGTSSPRRAAQLLGIRPDISTLPIRGNVATRLAKIKAGDADATLLAAAGLDRLKMPETGTAIAINEMLPAASQGAIGLDCLSGNQAVCGMLEPVSYSPTFAAVMAERAFLHALGGDCHSPVAAYGEMDGEQIMLHAEILQTDGSEKQAGSCQMRPGDNVAAAKLAEELLAKSSAELRALFGR